MEDPEEKMGLTIFDAISNVIPTEFHEHGTNMITSGFSEDYAGGM
jgi:hypothetical protein